jgi:hypothetical protein
MQISACFEGANESETRSVQAPGRAANCSRLRANVREALEQLARAASDVLRRSPGTAPSMGAAVRMARLRIEAYCDHLSRELEPRVLERREFGTVLSSHLRSFRARQQRELHGIEQLVDDSPNGAGVAHAVHVAALVLLADLDAHVRDLDLMALSPRAA